MVLLKLLICLVALDSFSLSDEVKCTKDYNRYSCDYNSSAFTKESPTEGVVWRHLGGVVEIVKAEPLWLYPQCWSITRVIDCKAVTTMEKDGFCFYSLEIIRSRVQKLSYVASELKVIDSTIASINLPHLQSLYITEGVISSIENIIISDASQGVISNSHIRDIYSLSFEGDQLTLSNVTISRIGSGSISFKGKLLKFENCVIHEVATKGIVMSQGTLMMVNTTIESATYDAIVTSSNKVVMKEVVFKELKHPTFRIFSKYNYDLQYVFMDNKVVNDITEYAQFSNLHDWDDSSSYEFDARSEKYCRKEYIDLQCDFSSLEKSVNFAEDSIPAQKTLTARHAASFRVAADFSCSDLILEHSSGIVEVEIPPACPNGGSLSLNHSNLRLLQFSNILKLRSFASKIGLMHSLSVYDFNLYNSSISQLLKMNVTNKMTIGESHVSVIASVVSFGQLELTNSYFNDIHSLVMSGESIIENCTITSLHNSKSIDVEEGELTLRNVRIETAAPASIYIGKMGKLNLRNVTFADTSYGVIHVAGKYEVYSGEDYSRTIFSLPTEVAPPLSYPEVVGINKPDCFYSKLWLQCDFSEDNDIIANISENNIKDVLVANSDVVYIYPSTQQYIALHSVKMLNVQPNFPPFHLSLLSSKLDTIDFSLDSLRVNNSKVNTLTPLPNKPLSFLVLQLSQVEAMSAYGIYTLFDDCSIDKIEFLSTNYLEIKTTNINAIEDLTVNTDVLLWTMAIKKLRRLTMRTKGKLINVTIQEAGAKSIVIPKGSTVTIDGLIIDKGEIDQVFDIQGTIAVIHDTIIGGVKIDNLEDFCVYYPLKNCDGRYSVDDDLSHESRMNLIFLGMGIILVSSVVLICFSIVVIIMRKRFFSNFNGKVFYKNEEGVVIASPGYSYEQIEDTEESPLTA